MLTITLNEIRRYGSWYERIREVIRVRYGSDADLFIDLLAALSPRSQVNRNWRQAVYVYRKWKAGLRMVDCLVGVMRSHQPNVIRALTREPLSGQKVQRFAENLKGNASYVTVDVWICKAYNTDPTKLTSERYAEIEQDIRLRAANLGITPSAYQATLWQMTREAEGRRAVSFMGPAYDDRQMNFWESE